MIKYLILDMGKVIVAPTTGMWLITPTFIENVDRERIDKAKLKEAMEKSEYILNRKVVTLEEEYQLCNDYYGNMFKEMNYNIDPEKLENIVRDFTYNVNDNKYYLYDDVEEELKRLSEKYTLLMLSDNWPCGTEYLKKHNIYKYFTKVYMSSVYGCKKCDGTFFDYPINEFEIKEGEALFVDDNESLLDVAVQKGLDVALMDRANEITSSKYKIIHSLKEL